MITQRSSFVKKLLEASVKLGGPGPLFEGSAGRSESKKGVQQQATEASVKLGGPGPLFEGFGPLRRPKGGSAETLLGIEAAKFGLRGWRSTN